MLNWLKSLGYAGLIALSAATSALAADDKLTVLLDWFVNPDHAPLVVALEGGYFTRHGLDVTLVPPADPTAPPRLIAAGEAEIGIYYQPNLVIDVAAGLPLVRFGTLVETPLNSLIVRADGPIKSIADLKGKSIGYSVSGFEDALLGGMLETAGLTLKDVTLVNVNFALSASLISGQVDAVIGGFRNFELTQMANEGTAGRAFFPEENGVPVYDELVLITRRDLIADPRLPRFLEALEEATLFLTNHPQEARDLFLKAYPDLDDKLNNQAFTDTLPRFAKRPAALDSGRYDRFADFLKARGLISSAPATTDYTAVLR